MQNIISAHSIFCDLKEMAKEAKIRSLRKLPIIWYFLHNEHKIKCYKSVKVREVRITWDGELNFGLLAYCRNANLRYLYQPPTPTPFSTGTTLSGRGQILALKVFTVTDVNFQLVQWCRVMPSPIVGLSLKTTGGPQSMYINQARINCTMEIFWADQGKQNNSPSNKQLIILITG